MGFRDDIAGTLTDQQLGGGLLAGGLAGGALPGGLASILGEVGGQEAPGVQQASEQLQPQSFAQAAPEPLGSSVEDQRTGQPGTPFDERFEPQMPLDPNQFPPVGNPDNFPDPSQNPITGTTDPNVPFDSQVFERDFTQDRLPGPTLNEQLGDPRQFPEFGPGNPNDPLTDLLIPPDVIAPFDDRFGNWSESIGRADFDPEHFSQEQMLAMGLGQEDFDPDKFDVTWMNPWFELEPDPAVIDPNAVENPEASFASAFDPEAFDPEGFDPESDFDPDSDFDDFDDDFDDTDDSADDSADDSDDDDE